MGGKYSIITMYYNYYIDIFMNSIKNFILYIQIRETISLIG